MCASSFAVSAQAASTSETTAITAAMPKPSESALASQPVMIRLRTHSMRYEMGLSVASTRNHSTAIRSRGVFIDEMKRKTKRSGNIACTDSPDPVRSARNAPSAPKPNETRTEKTSRTTIPPAPAANSTPTSRPTAM